MKFARTDRKALKPTRKHPSDAGIDFYALEPAIVGPSETKIVRTGIAIELPEGTMALAKPKSRHTRLIGGGVIDQDYRGEIKFRVYNTDKHHNLYISRGDPVGQLVIVPILTPDLERTSLKDLTKTQRGESGGINE
jgi:dUTP pyrophosphatase